MLIYIYKIKIEKQNKKLCILKNIHIYLKKKK